MENLFLVMLTIISCLTVFGGMFALTHHAEKARKRHVLNMVKYYELRKAANRFNVD